jgi:hypothetical protein
MFPTLNLYAIASKWRDVLKNDQDIIDFCQLKYGKNHTIFMGLDIKNPPKKDDCPYIIINPESKSEGGDQSEYPYSVFVGAGIFNDQKTITDNVVEMNGMQEISDFLQLILAKIAEASPSNPIARCDLSVNSIDFFPQHVGELTNEINITPAIGAGLQY